jgi:hypothetical protein
MLARSSLINAHAGALQPHDSHHVLMAPSAFTISLHHVCRVDVLTSFLEAHHSNLE